jgi:hypothetical protein
MYSHLEGCATFDKLKSFVPYSKYVCGNVMTSFNIINQNISSDSKLIVPAHFKLINGSKISNFDVDNIESFQCQISGKCKNDESFVDAAQREVYEEIGLFLNTNDFKEVHREVHSYKYGKNDEDINNLIVYYLVNVDEANVHNDRIRKIEIERNSLLEDDYGRRVVVFMYTKDLIDGNIITNRNRIKQYGVEEESFTGLYIFFPNRNTVLDNLIRIKDYWEYRKFIYNRKYRF